MRLIIIILIGFLLASCTTEPLPITIPQQAPKTVVFSQVIPNRVMIVALSKSFGALDLNEEEGDTLSEDLLNQLLEDSATVTIAYDGNEDTLFRIEKGLYASINTPQTINTAYTLRIINDAGEVVTANSNMLERIDFISIDPVVTRTDDTLTEISYSFEDAPGTNYYMVNFYRKLNSSNNGVDYNSIFANGQNNLVSTELISDAAFDGTYTKTSTFNKFQMAESDTIAVTLSNISEEYFKFLDLRKRGGNLFSEVTREPISYPTNVENGYGFFNTHSPDIRILDLNQF
jgi:hypothetical protein